MYIDGSHDYGLPTIANSTSATVSPNIHDAGSAKIVFGGRPGPRRKGRATITADASPTIKVDVVAADNDALTSNPVVLASSGVIAVTAAGVALASGDSVEFDFPVTGQTVAKRFYGLMVTLGGTNPDLAAGQKAALVFDAQTNMVGPRAAVPA